MDIYKNHTQPANLDVKMYLTITQVIPKDATLDAWLDDYAKIYNTALYELRQEFFGAEKEERKPKYKTYKELYAEITRSDLWKECKAEHHCKCFAIKDACKNWSCFYKAIKAWREDKSKFLGKPNIPHYYKDGKSGCLYFDSGTHFSRFNDEENSFYITKKVYKFTVPEPVNAHDVKCVYVRRYYGKMQALYVYEAPDLPAADVDINRVIGIDIGVNNLAAITSNFGESWLIRGGALKATNQYYNKRVAELKSIAKTEQNRYTTKRIERLTMKRKHKLEHEIHCATKEIIQLCIKKRIGRIVIGHNEGWKQNCNLGKRNNQNFVQLPFNDFIARLKYKAERMGIVVETVNESYTSKCDHIAKETMCHHEVYMGTRVHRGLFKCSCGKLINADINGAIGILRKAKVLTDADLEGLKDRLDIVSPKVLTYKHET